MPAPISLTPWSDVTALCTCGHALETRNLVSLPRLVPVPATSRWLLLNARSSRKHATTVREFAIDKRVDVLFLTETWLQEDEVPTFKENHAPWL